MQMTTATQSFTPVHIGTMPSGVEWVAYVPEKVEPLRRRFEFVRARQMAQREKERAEREAAKLPTEQAAAARKTKTRKRSSVTLTYVVGDETQERTATFSVPAGLSAVGTSDYAHERLYNRNRRTVTVLDENMELA